MRERFTPRERDETRESKEVKAEEIAETILRRIEEERLREDLERRTERVLSALEKSELNESNELSKEVRSRVEIESNDESLGYLLGAMRDGSVFYDKASRNYFTMYYQKHSEWLEDSISPRMEKLFDKEGKIEEYTPGHYRLKVSSKELYEMWKQDYDFPPDGEGQGSWNVPEDIKSANTHVKASYIRGVFDTEGDVSPESSKSCYVGISQKNETFIEEVRGLLEDLDIHAGKTHVIDEKSGTLRLAVSERKSLLRFITIIDSEHPDKHENLRRVRSLLDQET
jgi:intein-encoded DNA endonuclease-like protein